MPIEAPRAPVTVKVPAEAPLLVVSEAVLAAVRRRRFAPRHRRAKLVQLAARVPADDLDPDRLG